MKETQLEAYRRLSARCAQKEHCLSELRTKLSAAALTHAEAEEVLQRLCDEGFVDESRYARAFASDKLRFDRWGRVKIRYALRQKGVAEALIEDALDAADEDEYRAALDAFLKGKCRGEAFPPQEYAARQKLARAAISRGYEPHLVFARLRMEE